jgi:hypothetical protein
MQDMRESHERHLILIGDLILKIEKGEKLGSVEELRLAHKENPEKQKPKVRNTKT